MSLLTQCCLLLAVIVVCCHGDTEEKKIQYEYKEDGAEGLSYGCNGHIDLDDEVHFTYYIKGADIGLRVLKQDDEVQYYADVDHDAQWNKFPKVCKQVHEKALKNKNFNDA